MIATSILTLAIFGATAAAQFPAAHPFFASTHSTLGLPDPLAEEPATHTTLSRRGIYDKGCNCYGLRALTVDEFDFPNYALWGQVMGNGNTGYCISNFQLLPEYVQFIRDGLVPGGPPTAYVNTPVAFDFCDTNAGAIYTNPPIPPIVPGYTPEECVQYLVSSLLQQVFTGSRRCVIPPPPAGGEVWSCNPCLWHCVERDGFIPCGTTRCYNPATQACVSGLPVALRKRELEISPAPAPECPRGHSRCPHTRGGLARGYECLDTSNHLEACGGCPGAGGVDCSAFPGIHSVRCDQGKCKVNSCRPGWKLDNNECVGDKRRSIWAM